MTLLAPPGISLDTALDEPTIVVEPERTSRLARERQHWCARATAGAGTVAAVIVFVLWFRTGAFYARGDLAPFVRNSVTREFGSVWTHQNSGAGGPTYDIVRAFELAFIRLAHLLGGSDPLGQRLMFAAIFACAASGVAALASRLVYRAWLVFLAGMIGAFSPFTMVDLPNVLIPLCIGVVAWFAALTLDAASGDRRARPRLFAVLTVALTYLALNPPLLAIVVVWLLVLPFVAAAVSGTGWTGVRRSARFLARAAMWALPLAAWWLVPYVLAVRSAAVDGTIAANTNVFSWSWTQAHGSLDRVLTLVAKWSWPDAKLGQNASVMGQSRWLGLAFVLPIGLLAAPLVAPLRRRRAALWILLCSLVVALIGKGLNTPLRGLNAWAYVHIPGMFLLREPVSKVGTLLVPAIVLGWIIAIDGLASWFLVQPRRATASERIARAGIVTLAVAPLVFAFPMLTGSVVQSGERVHVPAAWHQVARIVDGAGGAGKALILPLDDFYQVPTTWGFYGADTLPASLITRPTITRRPQAYIASTGDFDDLVGAVEQGIVGADAAAVSGSLRALGVSEIVVRKDIDFASKIRAVEMTKPAALTAGLRILPNVRHIASTTVADVYEVAGVAAPVVALSGTLAAPGAQGATLASLVASAPPGTSVTTATPAGNTAIQRGDTWYVDVNANHTITPPYPGDWHYDWRATDAPLLELRTGDGKVVLRDPFAVEVGGRTLGTRAEITVPSPGRALAVEVNGKLVDVTGGKAYVRVAPGTAVRPLARGVSTHLVRWGAVGDCNRYDGLDPSAAALHADVLETTGADPIVRLRATRHSACVSAPLTGIAPRDVVRISLQQRGVRGAAPRTCLWQQGLEQCARLAWSVDKAGDWYSMSATYRVPARAGSLSEFLYADQPAAGSRMPSEAQYRRVVIDTLTAGPTTRVSPAPLPSGVLHLFGDANPITTAWDVPALRFGSRSAVGDCARTDTRSVEQLGISAVPLDASDPSAVRLSARHHSACVSMPILGLARAVQYEVAFDATVARGAAPRVCLWEETTQHCAKLDSVATPAGAHGTFRYRASIDPNASAWRLYLYADAAQHASVIEYSAVHVRAIADEGLVLRPATVRTLPVPEVMWHRDSPTRYRVAVRQANAPFMLALTDGFSNGWQIHGLPRGTRAPHLEINGYSNGWLIDERGDLQLTLEYRPARLSLWATRLSQLAAVALIAAFLYSSTSFRRRTRRSFDAGSTAARRLRRAFLARALRRRSRPAVYPTGSRRVSTREAQIYLRD